MKLDLLINLRFEKQKTMNLDLDPKLEFTDFDFMEQSNDGELSRLLAFITHQIFN